MKRILLVPIVLAILSSVSVAAPICVNASYDTYVALTQGCTIGDKLFTNFTYSATGIGTTPPASSSIQVVPQAQIDPLTPPGNGLFFSSGSWVVFAGQTLDVTLSFTVAAPPPYQIKDATLTMAGRVVSGTGVGTVTETITDASNTPIPGSPLSTSTSGSSATAMDFFAAGGIARSSVNVTTLIHVQANLPGAVTLSTVEEHFSQMIPEPAESLLIGSGILFLGLMWRKRTAR